MHWISKSLKDILSPELKDIHFFPFHNSKKMKEKSSITHGFQIWWYSSLLEEYRNYR
jgi:hypothetical protein